MPTTSKYAPSLDVGLAGVEELEKLTSRVRSSLERARDERKWGDVWWAEQALAELAADALDLRNRMRASRRESPTDVLDEPEE